MRKSKWNNSCGSETKCILYGNKSLAIFLVGRQQSYWMKIIIRGFESSEVLGALVKYEVITDDEKISVHDFIRYIRIYVTNYTSNLLP